MSSIDGDNAGMSLLPVFEMYQPAHGRRTEAVSLRDVFDDFSLPHSSTSQSFDQRGTNVGNRSAEQEHFSGDEDDYYDDDDVSDLEGNTDGKKRKRMRTNKNMSEEQKVDRREKNREHAKRSRVRKKFLLESLQHSVTALEEENEKLRSAIRVHVPSDRAESLLASCAAGGPSVLATTAGNSAARALDDPDYSLVKALQTAQQNFVITDPATPDNPIVYASQGFLTLTGYTLDQVLGRNCRFLQGPQTNPRSVDKIRHGIEKGEDTTVVLLNYRRDGSTFWNQFFIAALRDGEGKVVNYLGVQCMVSEEYAQAFVSNAALEDSKK